MPFSFGFPTTAAAVVSQFHLNDSSINVTYNFTHNIESETLLSTHLKVSPSKKSLRNVVTNITTQILILFFFFIFIFKIFASFSKRTHKRSVETAWQQATPSMLLHNFHQQPNRAKIERKSEEGKKKYYSCAPINRLKWYLPNQQHFNVNTCVTKNTRRSNQMLAADVKLKKFTEMATK